MKQMMKKHRTFVTKKQGGRSVIPGVGNQQNYAEVFSHYCTLAGQGNAGGQFELGMMFFCGQGVPQSNQEAGMWFRKAAEQGHAGAKAALVLCMPTERVSCKTIRKPAPRTIRPLSKESSSEQPIWA